MIVECIILCFIDYHPCLGFSFRTSTYHHNEVVLSNILFPRHRFSAFPSLSSKIITTFLAKKWPVGLYNRILERRKREHLLSPLTRTGTGTFMEFLSISVLTFGLVLIIAVSAKKASLKQKLRVSSCRDFEFKTAGRINKRLWVEAEDWVKFTMIDAGSLENTTVEPLKLSSVSRKSPKPLVRLF